MEHVSGVPYVSAVGSIMYVMVYTHLDISHTISVVSMFIKNLGEVHWHNEKWILYYLRDTTYVGLINDRSSNTRSNIEGFVDSYYTGNLDIRGSLTGYVFILSDYAISWKAILQSTVIFSTTEAEYMKLTEAMKEALWLRSLVDNLSLSHELTIIHCDSQRVIHLAQN